MLLYNQLVVQKAKFFLKYLILNKANYINWKINY